MKVNETKLVHTLKDAFTNDYAVITELAQNARRAGATKVEYTWDNDEFQRMATLTVEDNGSGIADFQDLFSVADSGWSAETVAEEEPFGMGFLLAVYLSESLTVISQGKILTATQSAILNLEDLVVEDYTGPAVPGTKIIMRNVNIKGVNDEYDFKNVMNRYLGAFPIEVDYKCTENDMDSTYIPFRSLDRNYDVEVLRANVNYIEYPCEIGSIFHHKDYLPAKGYQVVIYQGLFTGSKSASGSGEINQTTVFHMDSKAAKIRLPDREVFINADSVGALVSKHIRAATIALLDSMAGDYNFLAAHVDSLRSYGRMELLNNFDQFPSQKLRRIAAFPPREGNEDEWNAAHFPSQCASDPDLEKDEMANTVVFNSERSWNLFNYDSMRSSGVEKDAENYNFMLAYYMDNCGKEVFILDDISLGSKHWLHNYAVNFEDVAEQLNVTAVNTREPQVDMSEFGNHDDDTDFLLCDHIVISGPYGDVTVSQHALLGEAVVDDEGTLAMGCFIPNGETHPQAEQMAECRNDYDVYSTAYTETINEDLRKWLITNRMVDLSPSDYLTHNLSNTKVDSLEGKSFIVTYESGSSTPTVSEVIPPQ